MSYLQIADLQAKALKERVVVNQDNFLTTICGSIDSSKQYFVDGVVNIGANSITVPSGGIQIGGYGFTNSGLISSEDSYTMFVDSANDAGNFLMENIFIAVVGANSKVYDLVNDGTGFFGTARIAYNDCSSLGTLTQYEQGIEENVQRIGGNPVLELGGTWDGWRSNLTRTRSLSALMTSSIYKAGGLFLIESRFIIDTNTDLPTLGSFCDFADSNFSNPSGFEIQNSIITRDGALAPDDTNIFPNTTMGNISSNWKNNIGIDNTFVGGTILNSVEVETVINTLNVWESLLGTTVLTGEEHMSSPASGRIINLGASPREFEITGNVNIAGTANKEIEIRFMKWDDSATVFTPLDYTIQRRPINNFSGGRDVAFFQLSVGVLLDINDYIYLQVRNLTDTSNVTNELGSYFRLQER